MFGLSKQERLNRRLHKAARSGDVLAIVNALHAGAEIEAQDGSYAVTPLNRAALEGNKAAVIALLDAGADINARDRVGETPLINACLRGQREVAETLLDRGADSSIAGAGGNTAGSVALQNGLISIVRRLQGGEEPALPPPAPLSPAESPDEVVLLRPLGNRILEETFNFAARERISLLRNGVDGPVEAMTRESFDLVSEAALRHAFELYVKKGGTIGESQIFPGALAKPLPAPRSQP
jgi:hypothetical protein